MRKSWSSMLLLCFCTMLLTGCVKQSNRLTQPPAIWPPKLNQPYPDFILMSAKGYPVPLSTLKGKVVLIQMVSMDSGASMAYAGAEKVGGFEGQAFQEGLYPITKSFYMFTPGISLTDNRIIYIQLILFNRARKAPTVGELRDWERHFGTYMYPNWMVLGGTPEMVSDSSLYMLPGFQLLDQNLVLRADNTGFPPYHDLYKELLPMVRKLLGEELPTVPSATSSHANGR